MADIVWDTAALEVYLSSVAEELLPPLATEVEELARSIAPVRVRHTPVPRWAKRGRVGVPGKLKASVYSYTDRDYAGVYADIAALWYGRFMDPPARQLHRPRPFLPTALLTVMEGRTIHV